MVVVIIMVLVLLRGYSMRAATELMVMEAALLPKCIKANMVMLGRQQKLPVQFHGHWSSAVVIPMDGMHKYIVTLSLKAMHGPSVCSRITDP